MKNEYKRAILIGVIGIIVISILILQKPKIKVEESDNEMKAPEFQGVEGWINSKPLTMKELRGKVVLIDFWTYSCINCIRTFPYLRDWHEKYKDKGLVIIGIHSPEFKFERERTNIEKAAERFDLKWPIAMDNNYDMWRAYNNHYWPHKYLVDKDGNIRYDHIGEGGYEETEQVIQKLLAETGKKIDMNLTQEEERKFLPITPELYFGYGYSRGNFGSKEGFKAKQTVNYSYPSSIKEDYIYMTGSWYNDADNLKHIGNEDGNVILNFIATSVNIVASSEKEIKLYVYIDDKFINKNEAGDDVVIKNNQSYILVKEPRLYNVVKNNPYKRATLRLNTKEEGFSIFTFTFSA